MNEYILSSIANSLKNIFYWIERANNDIDENESAFLSLQLANKYAHELDMTKARFREYLDCVDWKTTVKKAKAQAHKEYIKDMEDDK